MAFQMLLYAIQRFQTGIILFTVCKADHIERRSIVIVFLGIIKGDALNTLQICQFLAQILSFRKCNIRYHDLCGSIGNELFLHNVQTLAALRCLGEVLRKGIFHLYPAR